MYIAYLRYWFDDERRPDGYSLMLGVFKSKLEACRFAMKAEMRNNYRSGKDGTDAYFKLYTQVGAIRTDEEMGKFERVFTNARETLLGEAHFTSDSTGYRYHVEWVQVNPKLDRQALATERDICSEPKRTKRS